MILLEKVVIRAQIPLHLNLMARRPIHIETRAIESN